MADKFTAEEIAAAGLEALKKRDADIKLLEEKRAKEAADRETEKTRLAAEAAARDKLDDDELGETGKEALRKERKERRAAEALVATLQADLRRREAADEVAKASKAASEGNFEALYKAELEKNSAAAEATKAQVLKDLRLKVAKEHNLPDEIAERLAGATEAELKVDAEKMAKVVKPTTSAASTEVGAGNQQGAKPAGTEDLSKANYVFMPAGGVPIPE